MAVSADARRVTPVVMTEASSDASTVGGEAEVDGAFDAIGRLPTEGEQKLCKLTNASATVQAVSSLKFIVSQARAFDRWTVPCLSN